jgi:hypothetical protein
MAGVELLQVLAAFGLAPGERDLGHLAHLGRPASQRFHELAKAEAAGRLRLKLVLVGLVHSRPILAVACPA